MNVHIVFGASGPGTTLSYFSVEDYEDSFRSSVQDLKEIDKRIQGEESMNIKKNLKRELLLVGLCVIATLIGPVLWIHAKFTFLYIFPGLFFSIVCIGISSVIYKATSMFEKVRLTDGTKYLVGIIIGYVPFSWFMIIHFTEDIKYLFRISRGSALLNFPFVIGFLVLSIVLLLITKNTPFAAISKAGMLYLLPIFIVIKLMPLIPNSEGKVIFGNVAIIYFFAKIVLTAAWPTESS